MIWEKIMLLSYKAFEIMSNTSCHCKKKTHKKPHNTIKITQHYKQQWQLKYTNFPKKEEIKKPFIILAFAILKVVKKRKRKRICVPGTKSFIKQRNVIKKISLNKRNWQPSQKSFTMYQKYLDITFKNI